jgi:hypothetical protein
MTRRQAAGAAALAAATVALFVVSRGKWSDPIIDSGREWIVPDALSRGDLLYRDVVYWFGPFTPYWHTLFFRPFGSSFRTLVLAGIVSSAAILVCLRWALLRVTDSAQANAWTALAIPWLIFMPDSGGAILGMGFRMWHAAGFGLLALTLALRRPGRASVDVGAGLAAGAAGLCRTEWGVAVLVAVLVALALRSAGRPSVGPFARVGAGFVLVFGGGLGLFAWLAGPAGLLKDAPILLFNLPSETRAQVVAPHPGIWARGFVQMAYCAFVWLGALALLEILARSRREPGFAKGRLGALAVMAVLGGICAAIAGFPNDMLMAGTPLLCAASVVLAFRTPRGPLAAALGGFGTAGVLTCVRRPFFLGDAPYVAPPVLFAIVCAAALLSRALAARESDPRTTLSAWLTRGISILAAVLFAARVFLYARDERTPIAGTNGMLSARSETVGQIESVAKVLRDRTPPGDGVVVFPEGEILNFLSGRPNPIRHKLYLPGYLNRENEPEILAELEKARPAAVVIWQRPLGEYGVAEFGVGYGVGIRKWVEAHYDPSPESGRDLGHPRFRLFLRRNPRRMR